MSLIKYIAGVPLFTTIPEALGWARKNNKSVDYHIHNYMGQKGYMGGANHSQVAKAPLNTKSPPTPTMNRTSSSGESLGSRGGGY